MNNIDVRKTLETAYEQRERIEALTGRVSTALENYIRELEKQIYGKEMS